MTRPSGGAPPGEAAVKPGVQQSLASPQGVAPRKVPTHPSRWDANQPWLAARLQARRSQAGGRVESQGAEMLRACDPRGAPPRWRGPPGSRQRRMVRDASRCRVRPTPGKRGCLRLAGESALERGRKPAGERGILRHHMKGTTPHAACLRGMAAPAARRRSRARWRVVDVSAALATEHKDHRGCAKVEPHGNADANPRSSPAPGYKVEQHEAMRAEVHRVSAGFTGRRCGGLRVAAPRRCRGQTRRAPEQSGLAREEPRAR